MRRLSAALAILLLLCLVPIVQAQDQRCFPETNQCISGRIREYWEQNGGLPVFGFPTTDQHEEQVEGKPFQVQWFERNRLELHPENAPPYDVLLGRLGVDRLVQQGRDWFTFPKGGEQPDCRHFTETGHTVCGAILGYFRTHGLDLSQPDITESESLALFGLPISEAADEVSTTDGKTYLTQHFERARFELHPENQPPFDVLLGLLGNEIRANAAPPAPPAPPSPPGQTPLPPSVNVTVEPERGPRGTRFFFTARGFKPGEKIGVYVTLPDQAVFGAPFQTTADGNGVSERVSFRPPDDPEVPTGIWAITFEGIDSHNKAIGYFEVTDSAAPQPPPPPPPPPSGGVPTPNAPCNQNAPGPAEGAQAWMTVTNPARRSNNTLCVRLIVGGNVVVGAQASGVAHYKTTDTQLGPQATGADGVAAITFNVGGPTPGYTVVVDVTVVANGQTYRTQTSFTPQ